LAEPRRTGYFVDGEVALVTGAGSGIGRAAALLFAAEGARVVVADLSADGAQKVADEIVESGGEAEAVACDVAADGAPDDLIARALSRFGRLDIAVNNAGISGPLVPTADVLDADFDRVVRVDLRSVWACLRAELRHFDAVGRGSIVNTASVAGLVGNPNSAAYTAAKHGVVGLTRTAAGEYGPRGIRVNAIAPGLTLTPMARQLAAENPENIAQLVAGIPLGRAADPAEIAEGAVWLASARASFVNGHVLALDGGFSIL
jgi:NAD(P)-dependent dehydrogenase (short-subunit alcohol dehydrogenase family)